MHKLLKISYQDILKITTENNDFTFPLGSLNSFTHLDSNPFDKKDPIHAKNKIKELNGKKIILLERNPIDTCISRYFYYKNRYLPRESYNLDADVFIKYHIHNISLYEFMISEYGLSHYKKFHSNIHSIKEYDINMIRYEDLVRNTKETFRSILIYLKISCNEDCLDYAVSESTFDKMKIHEKNNTFNSSYLTLSNFPNISDFYKVREGKIENYSYFTKDQLETLFTMI